MKVLTQLLNDEQGASMAEYALLLALIAVATIGALQVLLRLGPSKEAIDERGERRLAGLARGLEQRYRPRTAAPPGVVEQGHGDQSIAWVDALVGDRGSCSQPVSHERGIAAPQGEDRGSSRVRQQRVGLIEPDAVTHPCTPSGRGRSIAPHEPSSFSA